ncbi:unnamed protein product [Ectocarpus sp. 13 AM-2016]
MSTKMAAANNNDPLQDRFIGMFSYGSNNEQQLRARVHSPRLRGRPAYLDGYVRVFGFKSPPWSGSVASVAPKVGGRVYGRFYLMTPEEMEILDLYEAVKLGALSTRRSDIRTQAVMVNVCVALEGSKVEDGDGDDDDNTNATSGSNDVASSAITYIMSQRLVQTYVPPSPQYLTAVYRTLTSSFPEFLDRPLEICDYTGGKRFDWTYPGVRGLPLEAFLLEVGLREDPPWTFPTVLKSLTDRLASAGITTTDELCEAATSGVLLSKLAAAAAAAAGAAAAAAVAAAATGTAETPANTAATAADSSAEKLHSGGGAGSAGGGSGGGGGHGALPTESEAGGRSEEYSEWAEALRNLQSRATVADFTEQTVDIIARIVSGQHK